MKRMTKVLSLLLVMFTTMSLSAFASSSSTYYAKATATASGAGKVYVGKNNTAPAADAYQETSEVVNSNTSSGNSANVNFYLFAQPGASNIKFEGWYDNEECTGDALSNNNPYNAQITSNQKNEASAVTKNYYAKFVEATEFYSSTLTATSLGEGGSVAVSTESGNEDFGTEKSASCLNAVEATHTYYLQAKTTDADTYRFVAWYTDETCETQLTKNANYTYKVTAESTDEKAPTQFHAYAKFEKIPYYYSKVVASTENSKGTVFVTLDNATTPDFQKTSEAANGKTSADKKEFTYYLKAKYVGANTIEAFEGWYKDAECTAENLISEAISYTYKVTAESLDAENPTLFNVYAKFKDGYVSECSYQISNSDFNLWAADNEPGYGWNSFPSAVGSMASTGKNLSPNPSKVEGRGGEGDAAVRLYSKFAGFLGIGANANGNLTTGCVNMGSMTPTDASNHNFTDIEKKGHYMIIKGQPDGVEFYTKYKMGDGEAHTGQGQFIIHDEVSYIDPEREEQVSHRIAKVTVAIPTSEDWVKCEGVFNYEEAWTTDLAASTDKYILVNFTTNPLAGGSKDDELILDDVKLIYNSELESATFNNEPVVFVEDKASISSNYDETKLELIVNGRAASVEKELSKTGLLTITVKGENISEEKENYHTYTIQFNDPTTGINGVDAEGKKTLGKRYNVAGQRVNNNRGLTIFNGKKVLNNR